MDEWYLVGDKIELWFVEWNYSLGNKLLDEVWKGSEYYRLVVEVAGSRNDTWYFEIEKEGADYCII